MADLRRLAAPVRNHRRKLVLEVLLPPLTGSHHALGEGRHRIARMGVALAFEKIHSIMWR